jgi:hypothetical protein
MQAVERFGLDIEVLGCACCENDKDTAEVLETLYPDVRLFRALRRLAGGGL